MSTKNKAIYCSTCGESCQHDGANHVFVRINIHNLPKGIIDKLNFKGNINICYPCGYNKIYKPNLLVRIKRWFNS